MEKKHVPNHKPDMFRGAGLFTYKTGPGTGGKCRKTYIFSTIGSHLGIGTDDEATHSSVWFFHSFPMFLWFPMVFPWFSYGFPMGFLSLYV